MRTSLVVGACTFFAGLGLGLLLASGGACPKAACALGSALEKQRPRVEQQVEPAFLEDDQDQDQEERRPSTQGVVPVLLTSLPLLLMLCCCCLYHFATLEHAKALNAEGPYAKLIDQRKYWDAFLPAWAHWGAIGKAPRRHTPTAPTTEEPTEAPTKGAEALDVEWNQPRRTTKPALAAEERAATVLAAEAPTVREPDEVEVELNAGAEGGDLTMLSRFEQEVSVSEQVGVAQVPDAAARASLDGNESMRASGTDGSGQASGTLNRQFKPVIAPPRRRPPLRTDEMGDSFSEPRPRTQRHLPNLKGGPPASHSEINAGWTHTEIEHYGVEGTRFMIFGPMPEEDHSIYRQVGMPEQQQPGRYEQQPLPMRFGQKLSFDELRERAERFRKMMLAPSLGGERPVGVAPRSPARGRGGHVPPPQDIVRPKWDSSLTEKAAADFSA
ncbi:hypothetical protein T492DRAFT_1044137 [Pavlovales sp. CCMP2436]|nr:hypothetical protein T492DRAFT_1044137 [Pavlovales sp. CCMP2436]